MSIDKLCYFSNSYDAKPGKGVNEYVLDINKYNELSKIKDWRRVLSNFYIERFKWRDNWYNSVEHAYQGYKIGIADKDKGYYFTLDSGNEIGQGNGLIAQKNRKLVVLTLEQLIFFNGIKDYIMKDITRERIKQSDVYRNVLYNTKDAELWHIRSRKKPIRNLYMEELRNEIMAPVAHLYLN